MRGGAGKRGRRCTERRQGRPGDLLKNPAPGESLRRAEIFPNKLKTMPTFSVFHFPSSFVGGTAKTHSGDQEINEASVPYGHRGAEFPCSPRELPLLPAGTVQRPSPIQPPEHPPSSPVQLLHCSAFLLLPSKHLCRSSRADVNFILSLGTLQ